MKKILVVMCISMIAFWGCSSDSGTSLTLKNMAAGAIYLNFRGELTTVQAGKTVVISDLSRGTYSYVTTYSVPAGATSSTAVGELDGEIIINPGTQVLILYSSTLSAETYTIYASKTSNDDLDKEDNPIFP
jgi:hypothetical protein